MSTDIKLSKTHISKIIQSGGFLSSLLSKLPGPLMKAALPLAENILDPLGIRAAALAIDTGIQDKIHDSGTTTLIISNEEMNDIMKIVQALEDSNILLKGINKATENETKEQKSRVGYGNKGGKGILRTGYGFKKMFDSTPSFNKY